MWGQHGGQADSCSLGLVAGRFSEIYYQAVGFNKLGLVLDDKISGDGGVKEARKRLPKNLYNNRMLHIKRALDMARRVQILPEEQWTKHKEDTFYLDHI